MRKLAALALCLLAGCATRQFCADAEILPPGSLSDDYSLPTELQADYDYLSEYRVGPDGYYRRDFYYPYDLPTAQEIDALDPLRRRALNYLFFYEGMFNWIYGYERNALLLWTTDAGPAGETTAREIGARVGAEVAAYSSLPFPSTLAITQLTEPGHYRLELCYSLLRGQQAWLNDWILSNYGDRVRLVYVSPAKLDFARHNEGGGISI